ncbi:hypothetical protein CYMTET_28912, partial [Cymbomonas tetramitiformis]
APRSIHDLKPMTNLLQGLLKRLLNKEISFFSGDMRALREELKGVKERLAARDAELDGLKEIAHETKKAASDLKVKAKMGSFLGAINSSQKKSSKVNTIQLQELEKKNQEIAAKKEDLNETLSAQAAVMEKQRGKIKELEDKVDANEDKLTVLKRKVATSNHTVYNLEEMLKKEQMNSEKLVSSKEDLSVSLKSVENCCSTSFLPWVCGSQLVELRWASVLMENQATFHVPWGWKLEVPSTSMLNQPLHAFQLPGNCTVKTPASQGTSNTKTHPIIFPPFSCVHFPKDQALDTICVPGGTSIILPKSADGRSFDCSFSQECHIISPVGLSPNTTKSPRARASTTSSITPTLQGKAPNQQQWPKSMNPADFKGDEDAVALDPGSTAIVPIGTTCTAKVPTGCTYIVPDCGSRTVYIPWGSKVALPKKNNFWVAVPLRSTILLPSSPPEAEDTPPSSSSAEQEHRQEPGQPISATALVTTPGGTVVCGTPAASCEERYRVVLPPKTHIRTDMTQTSASKDSDPPNGDHGLPLSTVPAKPAEMKIEQRVSHPDLLEAATINASSRLTIAAPTLQSLQQLSERMHDLGLEASAVAVGMVPVDLVAKLLAAMEDIEWPAKILSMCQPEVAAKVVDLINHEDLNPIFHQMSEDAIASVMAHFELDHTELLEKLARVFGNLPICHVLARKALDFRMLMKVLSQPRQPTIPLRKLVDKVQGLQPASAAFLLGNSIAMHSAILFQRLASRDIDAARGILRAMAQRANMLSTLHVNWQKEDIELAKYTEAICNVRTEQGLLHALEECMCFMKKTFQLGFTIVRDAGMPVSKGDLRELEEECAEREKAAANEHLITPWSVSCMTQPSSKVHQALMRLDFVATNESFSWGRAGGVSGAEAEAIVGVTISPQALVVAQNKAFATRSCAMEQSLLVVPIFLPNGKPWGTLSHVNPSLLAKNLEDASETTEKTLTMPKVLACLRTVAVAMQVAVGAIFDKVEMHADMEHMRMERRKEKFDRVLAWGKDKEDGEDLDEGPEALAEALSSSESFSHQLQQLMRDFARGMASAVPLLRAMRNTPLAVKKVLVSVLIILGSSGFEEYLGYDLATWPPEENEDGSKNSKHVDIWEWAQKQLIDSEFDPKHTVNMMIAASKGLATALDLSVLTKVRMMAVETLLKDTTLREVTYASQAVAPFMRWLMLLTRKLVKQHQAYHLQTQERESAAAVDSSDTPDSD